MIGTEAGRRAFSVAEIILALAMISVAVLTLLGLSLRSLQSSRKVLDTSSGQLVAEQVLERLVYEAERNSTALIWTSISTPYQQDTVTMGQTVFNVTVYVTDVAGFVAPKRLRKLDSTVIWQDAPQGKAGQGRLKIEATRLLHEP